MLNRILLSHLGHSTLEKISKRSQLSVQSSITVPVVFFMQAGRLRSQDALTGLYRRGACVPRTPDGFLQAGRLRSQDALQAFAGGAPAFPGRSSKAPLHLFCKCGDITVIIGDNYFVTTTCDWGGDFWSELVIP